MREELVEQYQEHTQAFSKALSPFFSDKQIKFILDVWTLDVEKNDELDVNTFIDDIEKLYPFTVEDSRLRNAIDTELISKKKNHLLLKGSDLSKQFSQVMAFIFYSVPNNQLSNFFDTLGTSVSALDGVEPSAKDKIKQKLKVLSQQVDVYNDQGVVDSDNKIFSNLDIETSA